MEIISSYTLGEFLLFSSLLIGAIIGLIKFFDFINSEFHLVETRKSKRDAKIDKMDEKIDLLLKQLESTTANTETLMAASVSRIKGEIVNQHKRFLTLGYIDYKSLDYLQQQYAAYIAMGGNSYVHILMDDLDALPIQEGNKQ